jgi:hypothetical protein
MKFVLSAYMFKDLVNMRFIGISGFVTIVGGSTTQSMDPCTELTQEFPGLTFERNPGEFDDSYCMENGNCWEIFWVQLGVDMISGSEPEATQYRNNPVSCEKAAEVMENRKNPNLFQEADQEVPVESGQEALGGVIPTPGVRGIRNLGNSCYVSSAIQILSHLTPFRQLMQPVIDMNLSDSDILSSLSIAMRELWSGSSTNPINIQPILTALGLHSSETGDAHEVLYTILNSLSEAGVDAVSLARFTRIGSRICPGENGCNIEEQSQHSGLLIPLSRNMENLTLQQGMEIFFGDEDIHGYNCSTCHRSDLSIQITDRSFLAGPGEVLFVNFQRNIIEYGDNGSIRNRRLNTRINFPLEMNLADMPGEGQGQYRLVGIINHTGGHYYAEVAVDGHWYAMDDSRAIYLGNQPSQTNSNLVTSLVYERIED